MKSLNTFIIDHTIVFDLPNVTDRNWLSLIFFDSIYMSAAYSIFPLSQQTHCRVLRVSIRVLLIAELEAKRV